MKVSIGRMVHFVMAAGNNPGAHRPAIVTNVIGEGLCALTVFPDASRDGVGHVIMTTSTAHEEPRTDAELTHGTWHWPEREDT